MPLPDAKYQNSAGRLLAILTALPQGQAYLEVIPKLFDGPIANDLGKAQATMAGLLDIHKLYLEFREDMLAADMKEQQREVLLSGLASIQQTIYPTQLNAGYRAISDAEKALLEMAAATLSQEAPLQEDDVEVIRKSIASLRAIVEDAEISPTLRKVILDLIRMSEDAIARFKIYGARGLRRAYKAMLAEALETYGMATADGQQEEIKKSGAWNAIVQHLKTIDAVASRLVKYKPLFEVASRWLLGPPPS